MKHYQNQYSQMLQHNLMLNQFLIPMAIQAGLDERIIWAASFDPSILQDLVPLMNFKILREQLNPFPFARPKEGETL